MQQGTLVGPFRILEKIGAGGMGEVYLAHDTRLNRRVALKRLAVDGTDDSARRRLLREAQAAARLNHPHIAALHDIIEDGDAFIVMEYVEGRPLTELAAGAPLPVDRVLDIGRQLADALAYAHEHGSSTGM